MVSLPRKLGKHTPYFELVDAQSMSGCPVCRLAYKQTDRYLDSILYEAVLDPDVRTKLKNSLGFCREHTDMLRNKPGRALGIALIYRDIIRSVAEALVGARHRSTGAPSLLSRWLPSSRDELPVVRKLRASEPCPACKVAEKAETRIVELLIAHLAEEKLYQAYAQGEGLCLEHLVRAIALTPNQEILDRLLQPQSKRYLRMLTDLDEFIRKRDHRFRGEKYGEEGDVWLRAMNAIVGGAGMGLSAESGGRQQDTGLRDKER
jgi:hypothetical protein